MKLLKVLFFISLLILPALSFAVTVPVKAVLSIELEVSVVEEWAVGHSYKVGSKVLYNGNIYICIQACTAASAAMNPENTPAFWKLQPQT